jgi:DNA-binding GntR family transcriptional regulator
MSASSRAYTFAKERILDGRFAGGELISEGDVARPTGLSRTPVREAFLQLESEGFLKLYPKRGALVVPVSAAEVESVMETRLLVERFALDRTIERKAEIAGDLERSLATQATILADGDPHRFVEVDREFHRIFMVAAGNPILLDLLDSLRDRQSRMGVVAITREPDRMETILSEHHRLAEAVIEGEAAAAGGLLAEHLAGTLRALRWERRRG